MNTKEQVAAVLSATGTETVGALVFWSLSGVRIRRSEFREALQELNLEMAQGKDPSPRATLSKAVPSALTGKRGVLCRRLLDGKLALVLERVTAGKATYDHVATLSAAVDEPEVTFLGDTDEEQQAARERLEACQPKLLDEIRREYSEVRHYLGTQDLSEILIAALNGSPYRGLFAGLSLRERTGGLYFIAGTQVLRMQALRRLVENLAPGCVISVMTITGNHENLEQAARVARVTFSAQLAELKSELADFHAGLEGKAPSEHSISTRLERYRDLKARVDVFKEILGSVTSELNGDIETARVEMLQLLEPEVPHVAGQVT